MNDRSAKIIAALREALQKGGQPFAAAMFNRIRELSINMVNGQVLADPEADSLATAAK